ncbi:MAG TPA: lipoate--protein ligase family protein [Firmicutes bacterium]|nr:lipoate--protein ligase family protein [Bacillota bacterium]
MPSEISYGNWPPDTWRFLNTGFARGSWNMAVDEAILTCHAKGVVPPTVRLYGWSPPALSLGRIQSLKRDVDRDACIAMGIDIVRRPTGGRAVLHDKEVTYSFILAESNPLCPKDISGAFSLATSGIIHGLAILGIDARIHGGPGRREGDIGASSPACFDSPSWYEVVAGGKKLVGSAQARMKGVLMQHGSILLELEPEKVARLFRFSDSVTRDRIASELEKQATSVSRLAGRPVRFDEVASALRDGFRRFFAGAFGITLKDGELLPEELCLARELERDKYGSDSWTALR